MSLGKLPGIKGLVSGSQGKRRFRSELSVDMIGPPLGDFRHTMHVGRGGDVFGDTSFLSSYGGSREPGSPDSAAGAKADGFFARTFRQGWKSAAPRPRGGSRDLASPPPDVSPIIKNAVSLPQLNMDIGGLLPGSLSSTDDSLCTYGLSSGFLTLPRPSRLDRQLHEASLPDGGGSSRSRSDSLTSFTVDLGPSLMTEVLTLIDSSSCLRTFSHRQAAGEEEQEEEEEEEEDSSLTDTPAQSPGATSPSGSFRRTRPEEGGGAARTGPSADSPLRAEPVMEAERFQRAADVLSRHYGGGSFTKGTSNNFTNAAGSHSRKTSQAFSEEEEEIKV